MDCRRVALSGVGPSDVVTPQLRGVSMIRSARIGLLIAVAASTPAALAVTGCGGSAPAVSSSGGSVVLPTTANGTAATVGVANAGGLGKILVDSQGRTLYLFQKDTGTRSACSGACAAAWPPLRATAKPSAGTSLSAAKLGTTPRSDGKPQVTYNGHPLYLYSADQNAGDTNGQGINAFGAAWFVLSPSGNMVVGKGTNPNPGLGY
jgi:predicted lipoprotein with Yx(FWY)xxD motif